jgi:hypothetical protein
MLKIALEAAALIGVVVAVIVGSFYALGTVAHFAYFNALGFDGHQFPAFGSELHLSGALYVALPALFLYVAALIYACVFALSNRAYDHTISQLSRRPFPAKWRIPVLLVTFVAILTTAVVGAVLSPPALQWILAGILVVTVISSSILLGKWVLPATVCCFIGVIALFLVIKYVTNEAFEAGKARAKEAGKSNASTIIELTDSRKITVPGVRVVCSERFCGFHDGERATVISLEGVQIIHPPVPQEQPPHTSDK